MILDGVFIDQFSYGILLFVEEDIQFLISAYFDLENLLKTLQYYQYSIFLNDNLLSLTATYDITMVEVEFRYCLELNIENLVTHNLTVTEDEYTWRWRSIAYEILQLTSLGKPS